MTCAILLSTTLATCLGPADAGIHARLAWSETRGLRITEVPERGPAHEAGLQPGDRVIAIDGHDTALLTLREVLDHLRGRSDSWVELEVSRDGVRETIRMQRSHYQR